MTEQEQQGRRVLIADDDPLILRMYQRKLRADGYDVAVAHDGSEVLVELQRNTPEIIMLDIMMPVMNGVETLKAIKNNEKTKDIPVIMLTNLGDRPEDIEKAKAMGARDYLVKADTELSALSLRIKKELGDK